MDCYMSNRFTWFGDYTIEDYTYRQQSRQRTPGTPANDSPANDWQSDQKDRAHTVETGVNGILIDRKRDATVTNILSHANGVLTTKALGNGSLLTTIENYPGIRFRLHQFG